jgi:hypothetical protein
VWDHGREELLAQSLTPTGQGFPVHLSYAGEDAAAALVREGGAWLVKTAYPSGIFVQHQTSSGNWEGAKQLAASGMRSGGVAASSDGTVITSWVGPVRDSQLVHGVGFVRRLTAAGWSDPQSLDTRGDKGFSETLGLTIAMDPYGNAVASWITRDTYVVSQTPSTMTYESSHEIRSQRFDATSGWAPVHVKLDPDPPSATTDPAAALDPERNGLSIWATASSMHASRFLADSGWQAPKVVDTATGAPVKLAVDDGGRAIAVWIVRGEIRAARFLDR